MADAAELNPLDETPTPEASGASPPPEQAAFGVYPAAVRGQRQRALDQVAEISDDAGYEALKPGQKFKAPDGTVRTKPYMVKNDREFDALPEGVTFLDPEGNERQKPAYEALNYTAQTLHSMALNSKEQKKALEHAYPDAEITQDANGEWVVNDNGVMRKAGATRGVKPFLGAATAMAAPTAGAVLGAVGGAAAGAPSGPGAFVSGAIGGGTGAIGGQMVNDLIFSAIAGSDRTTGEEAANLGLAGLTGMAGAGVGRGLATMVPSIKAGASAATAAVPGMLRSVTGATKEGLERGEALMKRGYAVPPSATMPEAPHVQNMVEILDPAFRTDKPLVRQNQAAYEREASGILREAGVPEFQPTAPSASYPEAWFQDKSWQTAELKPVTGAAAEYVGPNVYATPSGRLVQIGTDGQRYTFSVNSEGKGVSGSAVRGERAPFKVSSLEDAEAAAKFVRASKDGAQAVDDLVKPPSLIKPEAAIPTARVGEALREKAIQQAGEADKNLQQAFEQRRAALAAGQPATESQNTAILRAQTEARRAVDNLLNENYAAINQDVERAYRLANVGANSGEAWQQVADRLRETRRAIGERASRMYEASHEMGGDTPISSNALSEAAQNFAQQLPPEFRTTQPGIVRRLEALAGEMDADGVYTRPPTNLTFRELHELRTLMRTNADFNTLASDVRNGTFKHFNNVIDEAINDAHAAPHLRTAAAMLDQADAFYREQMPIFHARELQAVMRGIEAGEPANPIALYRTLVDANKPDLTARIREMVGPNLWSAVQAAHVQDLMQRSMSTTVRGAVDGPAFARNVLSDYNSGLLQQVQNRAMSDQLLRQADLIAMSRGKLDIPVAPGDRMIDIIAKARAADEAARNLGNTDPLAAMKKAGEQIAREERAAMGRARGERNREPLGFLFDAKVGTQEAADRILRSPDLLLAAADKFGRESAEFKLLQQAYLWKVLQGDMNPGAALSKVAPEIQHLMFPGTTLKQVQELAKDMEFLANTKLMKGSDSMGGSMMAVSKVEHPPLGSIRGVAKRVPLLGQASEFGARAVLTKFYAIMAKITAQSPGTMEYMLRGLRGTPEQRAMTKQAIEAVLQRGTAVGAGVGEGAYQGRTIRDQQ